MVLHNQSHIFVFDFVMYTHLSIGYVTSRVESFLSMQVSLVNILLRTLSGYNVHSFRASITVFIQRWSHSSFQCNITVSQHSLPLYIDDETIIGEIEIIPVNMIMSRVSLPSHIIRLNTARYFWSTKWNGMWFVPCVCVIIYFRCTWASTGFPYILSEFYRML